MRPDADGHPLASAFFTAAVFDVVLSDGFPDVTAGHPYFEDVFPDFQDVTSNNQKAATAVCTSERSEFSSPDADARPTLVFRHFSAVFGWIQSPKTFTDVTTRHPDLKDVISINQKAAAVVSVPKK